MYTWMNETQVVETNGTNTELLKSPVQALLTRATGIKKTCKMHEWAGWHFDKGASVLKTRCNQSTLLSRVERPLI